MRLRAAADAHGVRLLYLHGSYATGRATAERDLDLTAWLGDACRALAGEIALLASVANALPASAPPVDLVILDLADPLLQFLVPQHGRLLYEAASASALRCPPRPLPLGSFAFRSRSASRPRRAHYSPAGPIRACRRDTPMADPPHILIAGAGYAGLAAYLSLRDDVQRGDVAVTVVNADDRHLLLPEIPLYLAGESGPNQVRLYLRNAIKPPAQVQVATIERVEPDGPALICKAPAGRLQGNGLLVALGSVSDDFGVPGVKEHTTPIGRWDDMRELRDRLLGDLHSKAATSVAVIGGGLTGVEIASELADRSREQGSGLKVKLVAPGVLKNMPESVRKSATDALKSLGVEMTIGRAEAVEAGRVRLQGGGVVEAASLVWAAGVRANPAVATSGLPTNRRGQLHADQYLRAAPRLYVAGDCADIRDGKTGQIGRAHV